jgi:uncharacterized protein
MVADEVDRAAVRELLGREPSGAFDVVVRDDAGAPVVIRNAPYLDDGTPMPTRYWLVGRREVQAVSRLEAAGGVRRAEAEVDPVAVADAHRRYAAERDEHVAAGGPLPSGGVGGTRQGVKCLHAHYAWHLAGGDDPVGRWVADQLRRDSSVDGQVAIDASDLKVVIEPATTTFHHAGSDTTVAVGPATLVANELAGTDPPDAAQLTNALGLVADHLDDLLRADPEVLDAHTVHVSGEEPWHLVVVERGGPVATSPATLERDAAEDVFRLLATETRAQRLANPGLDPNRVDTVVATCCLVLTVMRRLHLDRVTVAGPSVQAG